MNRLTLFDKALKEHYGWWMRMWMLYGIRPANDDILPWSRRKPPSRAARLWSMLWGGD